MKQWRHSARPIQVTQADCAEELLTYLNISRATDLILDIEPWLVHWSEPADVLDTRLHGWTRYVPASCRIHLCTNSKRFRSPSGSSRLTAGAGKPLTPLHRLLPLGEHPVVAGDLLLLDGLLARRLTAHFVWLRWRRAAPPWPRALQFADRLAEPILLRRTER